MLRKVYHGSVTTSACALYEKRHRLILTRVSRYAVTPVIVALSLGHSDITRFRPWSLIATGNHFDRAENIPNLLRRLAPLTCLIRVHAFRDLLRTELPHVQIFMDDGPNPLT